MEEKKPKVVGLNTQDNSVNTKTGDGKDNQKLSYEQLNTICSQLYQENQRLAQEIKHLNYSNMFKRLDYLFMVLNASQVINDPQFIDACAKEIKEALTINVEKEAQDGEKQS